MSTSVLKGLSIEGKGLQYKLVIIQALLFVLPFSILTYLLYTKEAFANTEYILAYLMILFVVLSGLIILRQIFDRILKVSHIAEKVATGFNVQSALDSQADMVELNDISHSFQSLLVKFQETTTELKSRVNELAAIKELTEIANQAMDIRNLLDSLAGKSQSVANATFGVIFLVENNQPLQLLHGDGLARQPDKETLTYDLECQARLAILKMKPQIATTGPGRKSTLSIPVVNEDDMTAVLMLVRNEDRKPFVEEDLQTISVMLSTINFALRNTVLHHRSEQQVLLLREKSEALAKEIHDRKQIEASLQETQEMWRRYAFIVNTAREFMTLINRDLRYEAVSNSYCIAHKKSPDQILNKTVQEIWGPESADVIQSHLDRCFSGQEVSYQESFEFDRGGSRHYDVSYYPYRRSTDGEITHAVVVTHDVNEHVLNKISLEDNIKKLKRIMSGIIDTISAMVEIRDPYTAGHQRAVARIAEAIAQKMNLSKEQTDIIKISAEIHDIGKIYIPAEILSKPSALDDVEFNLIKSHPEMGHVILNNIDFPVPIAPIIIQHHERMDGSGYPHGLSGDQICLEARIIAVADVIDSISSHRPYQEALGIDQALEELRNNRGILYDPEVVDACLQLYGQGPGLLPARE
ncbi:MAG: HD domain-containing protein [Deltaproteobacteria bacterium]|nr:HD domain-containing protein [Deltaproteobacteria bacterium]